MQVAPEVPEHIGGCSKEALWEVRGSGVALWGLSGVGALAQRPSLPHLRSVWESRLWAEHGGWGPAGGGGGAQPSHQVGTKVTARLQPRGALGWPALEL